MRRILSKMSWWDWFIVSFLIVLGIAYLILIWGESVGLRNGDYSDRVVRAQNIRLTPGHFMHDIWRHVWPPMQHVVHRMVISVCTALGMSTAVSIKVILSLASFLGLLSLYVAYRIANYFASPRAGVLCVLAITSLPIFHVVSISALGQAFAFPILLAGLLLFCREIDRDTKFYLSGARFFVCEFISI